MSRKNTLLYSALLCLCLAGCSSSYNVFTEQSQIQENEARFDYFAQRVSPEREFIGLMCRNQRLTGVAQLRDLPPGEHVLWVKAVLYGANHNSASLKEATAKFNVTLDGGKRYTVLRDRDGDELTLWIAESDSGEVVSDVITAQASPRTASNKLNYNEQRNQCREGTA